MAKQDLEISGSHMCEVFGMKSVAKFEKVSFDQFILDFMANNIHKRVKKILSDKEYIWVKETYTREEIKEIYDNIKLPQRGTSGSAGYDFFIPFEVFLEENEPMVIPTGIRCKIDEGYVLDIYPRSGLGFKNKMSLYNTVGIIDSDYYNSNNEGHIMIKIVHENPRGLQIESGKGFAQGIFNEYFITYDDETTEIRNGAFGSTDSNNR